MQREVDQPVAGRVFDVVPKGWPPAPVIQPPVSTFELKWDLSMCKRLPPSTIGIFV
jgi:hypothetical protein